MDRKEKLQTDKIIDVFIVFSLVCLCLYGLFGIYGFSLFPDEFGYWAPAAYILGCDWSDTASIGSYYSFGYSLILTPILALLKNNSIAAYRAAIAINLLLQTGAYFIVKKILRCIFKEKTKNTLINILAGIAVLYPSWIFYTQMTMSEGVIFFLYYLVIWLMLKYLDTGRIRDGVLAAVSSVYLYSVHMRTIGVLASVFIIFLIDMLRQKGKKAAPVISAVIIAAGFITCLFIKNDVIRLLYSSGNIFKASVNDYSGQTSKLIKLLSPDGILKLLLSASGKLLYLGCASFGTAYIGISCLFKRALKKDVSALLILLTSVFQFIVMNIYLIDSADKEAERFDLFLHGRYFDFAIPLLMILGISELLFEHEHIRKMFLANIVMLLLGAVSIFVCMSNKTGMRDPHGMLMIGMSYFLDEDDVQPVSVIILSLIMSFALCFVVTLLVTNYKEYKKPLILSVLLIIQLALGYHAINHFIYIGQSYIYGDIQAADRIAELRKSEGYSRIILLYEGGKEYIDTIQFRLPDERIEISYAGDLDEDEKDAYMAALPEDGIILVDYESGLNDTIRQKYEQYWESGHFAVYFN